MIITGITAAGQVITHAIYWLLFYTDLRLEKEAYVTSKIHVNMIYDISMYKT